jgi:signal transduction histidine kinase/DNA-binding response OmpR family regulator
VNALALRKFAEADKHREEIPLADNGKVSILVVDDLPEKLLAYRTILEELDQNLFTVSSGEETLRLLLKHEFAVILLDVNMPGMDGFETASLIRKRKKSARTPIIFLTAFTDEVLAAQGYASGAVDYLPTPIVPEVLRAKVRVFIELSQMRRQAALQAEERAMRTAAEDSARRSAFLVKVSEILSRARNQSEVMRALVELPLPYLADMGIIWLGDDEDRAERARTEWAWTDRHRHTNNTKPLISPLLVLPWLEKAIREVSSTGQAQILKDLSPPSVTSLPALSTALVMPLNLRGQTHGVLVLARQSNDEPYHPNDISLGSDLASRASVALEKVMLIERIQEADRRKDEFLGMLAHELRNPLGPIRNSVQLLQWIGPKEPRLMQLSDIIDRQVTHMTRLIDDLLDATRLAHGKILLRKERCNLCKIVQQTIEDYRSIFDASGLELETHIPSNPLWVEGDPTRLVQAIGNLLHNAHKFTNPGGRVIIRLEQNEDGQAVITISDTGIGIETKMLPFIFDVFRQAEQGLDRARGGLGLGLALVKGLIKLHGGEVQAFSKGPGQGAEFTIRLPVVSVEAAALSVVETTPVTNGEKYRILVIEDNKDTAESARLLLSLDGYDVQTANNGSAGLEVAQRFHPQVVLCDIGLPGMDGYQVARTLRQDSNLSSAYIIALTGYGRDEDLRQAQEAGFDMHLTKPIDHNNLRRALTHLSLRV